MGAGGMRKPRAAAKSARFAAAAAEIAAYLADRDPAARPLSKVEIQSHGSDRLESGWRINLQVGEDVHVVDVLIDRRFPFSIPRIGLVKAPPPLTWPHAEPSLLCLYDEFTSTDVIRPVAVLEAVLQKAATLIAASVRGETHDDFRTEFPTYWAREHVALGSIEWRSLVTPQPPSRVIRVWAGASTNLVADDVASMQRWLEHFFGRKDPTFCQNEAGVLLWLPQPLLPSEYPDFGGDVVALARTAGVNAPQLLEELADAAPRRIFVLLGAFSTDGPCLAGVTISKPECGTFQKTRRADPINRGFRPGHIPKALLRQRYLASAGLTASTVSRVDARWIHGRDHDPRQEQLAGKHVVVLGCGSLGAPIALKLAAAGVGRLTLVDPQTMTGPNISRHPLGAADVGRSKAIGLRERLQRSYPHITSVNSHTATWQEALADDDSLFVDGDLVVVAIGNWHAEAEFNDWHVHQGRTFHVVYVWTEPRACAGHAVAICPEGGCLHCGFEDSGAARVPITLWPDDMMREREPGCGAVFQPYGAVEMTYIEAVGSELALDCLLEPPSAAMHRTWVADRRSIERAKGLLNPAWVGDSERRREGGCRDNERWGRRESCPTCGTLPNR
jgi:sulfur-carrier protein adenylyltransferase/sulfurtransferase